jgi:HK97 family phage portal protein
MWPFRDKSQGLIETKINPETEAVLRELIGLSSGSAGISVTPETCMKSPTVHAIVHAVSRRISVSSLGVFRKTKRDGRDVKESLPNHPVARLLEAPNDWQTKVNFWYDTTSALLRYGNAYGFKGRGKTGPILRLLPMHPGNTRVEQDKETMRVQYVWNGTQTYQKSQIFHARLGARNFYEGDSPINDVQESIALEIAAERFGSAFFANGAMPLIYFKLMEGFKDFRTDEERDSFLQKIKEKFSGRRSFSTMLLPKGMELDSLVIDNEKSQFIETRRFIRSVIAGAYGVPPHLVGDLERATFNNVEQQDADFIVNVILPIAKIFEAAMERDLLTEQDRRDGVIIRFNLDSIQRADFKSRQEGFRIMRESGVISANDWREMENWNPLDDGEGGNDYIRPLNFGVAGQEPEKDEETDPTI